MIDNAQQQNMRVTLMVLLFLVSGSALGVGYYFIKDPSGSTVGFTIAYLRFSPFVDYFWPGWILFTCIGVYGILCFLMVAMRFRNYPFHVMVQGMVLLGWILIQIAMVRDFNLLHALCLLTGAVLFVTGRMLIK